MIHLYHQTTFKVLTFLTDFHTFFNTSDTLQLQLVHKILLDQSSTEIRIIPDYNVLLSHSSSSAAYFHSQYGVSHLGQHRQAQVHNKIFLEQKLSVVSTMFITCSFSWTGKNLCFVPVFDIAVILIMWSISNDCTQKTVHIRNPKWTQQSVYILCMCYFKLLKLQLVTTWSIKPMIIHTVHDTQVVMLHHTVSKLWQCNWNVMSLAAWHFNG
jgi:hypothetical protein